MTVPASSDPGQLGGQHGTAASDGDAAGWLVLAYQLPAKPASLKAAVRRKLTAAGAVCLSPACAVALLSSQAGRSMRRRRAMISGAGGSAVLLAGRALAGEAELTGAFNAVCDPVYEDIIGGCHDAMAGIEALTTACEFRYQPLWGKDISLRQLSARYRAVCGPDRVPPRQAPRSRWPRCSRPDRRERGRRPAARPR